LKAYRCNKCYTFENGEASVRFEYGNQTIMGEDPEGALCGECALQFILWLKEKPNANT